MKVSHMTTHLWELLVRESRRQAGRFQSEVTAADMSRATDGALSPALISKWKHKPTMPSVKHLVILRDRLNIRWPDLLDAMLADKGYLPEPPSMGGALRELEEALNPQADDEAG